MSSLRAKCFLLFLILTPLVANHHQAASGVLYRVLENGVVIHDTLTPWLESNKAKSTERPLDTTPTTTAKPLVQPKATKFIILTTGEQIKLYPLVPDPSKGPRASQYLMPTENHYLLVTNNDHNNQGKQGARDDSQELTMKPGNNSFSQSLLKQQQPIEASGQQVNNSHPHGDSRRPTTNVDDRRSEDNYNYYDSDYRSADSLAELERERPWFVDVDYFFDQDFCHFFRFENQFFNPEPHDCLVIVWLDKNNKLVRYGSINLATNPITTLTASSSSKTNNLLTLREFPPIVVGESSLIASENNKRQLAVASQVHGMVIDKKRRKLYVAFSNGSKLYANRILSGGLKPVHTHHISESQLRDETTLHFNECLDSVPSSQLSGTTFDHMSIDEDSGDWLFFLNQARGGKINAINVNPKRVSDLTAPQALVKNIPGYMWRDPPSQSSLDHRAIGMAMEPKGQRFIWLTENKWLRSCDYAGSDERFDTILSHRPVIRSSYSMQVLHDTLYISDPIKNTLIAHSLNKSDMDWLYTHRVLLVEMPSIYGFRVVDIEAIFGKGIYDSLDNSRASLADISGDQPNISVEDSVASNKTELKLDYNHLLLDRSWSNCGYVESDLNSNYKSTEIYVWLLVIVGRCLMLILFFALWYLLVKLNQYFKDKKEKPLKIVVP